MPKDVQSYFGRLIQYDAEFQRHYDRQDKPLMTYLSQLVRVATLKQRGDPDKLCSLAHFLCERQGEAFEQATFTRILANVRLGLTKTGWRPEADFAYDPSKYFLITQRLVQQIGHTEQHFLAFSEIAGGLPDRLPLPSPVDRRKWLLFATQRKALGSVSGRRPDFIRKDHATPAEESLWTEKHLASICYFAVCAGFCLAEIYQVQSNFVREHSPAFNLSLDAFLWFISFVHDNVACHGVAMNNKMECQLAKASKPSEGRPERKLRDLGPTAHTIALRSLEGMKPAAIANKLGITRGTVAGYLRRIKQRGGIQELFPELHDPFTVPLARELFELCKLQRHSLTADQANRIMKKVSNYASPVNRKGWLNASRIRKALAKRKRNSNTPSTRSDSENSMENSLRMAVALEVVRKNAVLHRLAMKLKGKLRLKVRRDKNADRSRKRATEGNPRAEYVTCTITQYATAVRLAFEVMEFLREEGAPTKVKGNVDWIFTKMKTEDFYKKVIRAPAAAYRKARIAADERRLKKMGFELSDFMSEAELHQLRYGNGYEPAPWAETNS
jgi:DNA-binding CsgD family transcriptional regulator